MLKINGIIPPIVTPMNEDESINEKELIRQVNRLIASGVHGIFCCGTSGEFFVLNDDEKENIIEIVVKETRGRVPVYAGTGCIGTRDTIRLSCIAQKKGADVLSIITPYFAVISQTEIYEYFKEIAASVNIPIVVYNIPARTGVNVSPAMIAKLSEIDNIAGVKDSSGNFDNMLQYIEKTKNQKFSVLSGNDSLILWNLLAGGAGGIAACANVYPETISSIYKYFLIGDINRAKEMQDSIRSFRDCFKYGNANTIIKIAVDMLGYPVGKCRKPFSAIPPDGIEALRKVLEENKKRGMQ
jgi:4-hydroxy-tetrahydrodipicolinate synthase